METVWAVLLAEAGAAFVLAALATRWVVRHVRPRTGYQDGTPPNRR